MRHKESFAELLKREEERQAGKLREKLPLWASDGAIRIPSALALEQCSSQATAAYKAEVAARIVEEAGLSPAGAVVADITGGLGADSAAFSGKFGAVLYSERNPDLVSAAEDNFKRLGICNVHVRLADASDAVGQLQNVTLVYMDPARRDGCGKKVFKLQDCQPDMLGLKDAILGKAPFLMAKLSPMADISILAKELGPELCGIHIVGTGGECKEVLCLLKRGHSGGHTITVHDDGGEFIFKPEEEKEAKFRPSGAICPGMKICEPCHSLLKSGAFNLMSARFGFWKIGHSTQLYCTESGTDVSRMFKRFTAVEVLPFCNASFAELRRRRIRAGVSARNVPIKSEELAKKTGIIPGDDAHIFAVTQDLPEGTASRLLIICRRDI